MSCGGGRGFGAKDLRDEPIDGLDLAGSIIQIGRKLENGDILVRRIFLKRRIGCIPTSESLEIEGITIRAPAYVDRDGHVQGPSRMAFQLLGTGLLH